MHSANTPLREKDNNWWTAAVKFTVSLSFRRDVVEVEGRVSQRLLTCRAAPPGAVEPTCSTACNLSIIRTIGPLRCAAFSPSQLAHILLRNILGSHLKLKKKPERTEEAPLIIARALTNVWSPVGRRHRCSRYKNKFKLIVKCLLTDVLTKPYLLKPSWYCENNNTNFRYKTQHLRCI